VAQKSFRLEIVTPEKVVYDDQVVSLTLPASDGLMGVWPNHAPILASLSVGEVTITQANGGRRHFMVSDGFFEMAENHARILANAGETVEEIDIPRAEAALDRARARLKEMGRGKTDVDQVRAELALQRALWRVRVARRRGR
jgi:F-type H+-transporting ATPase subunit epsilon